VRRGERQSCRVPLLRAIAVGALTLACFQDTDPFTRPRGAVRTIDFVTEEGTWISVDVSPDGRWIVFDLLAHIYRMPAEGGDAVALTQSSGIALNFHPAYSPDGTTIAFVSDRFGQNNIWVMNADGRNPRPIFLDDDTRFTEPVWTPDGGAIVAVRAFPTPGRGWHRQITSLWLLPVDGGEPQELLSGTLAHYHAPAFSPDGRYLYYHVSYSTGEGLGLLQAGHRIQRRDMTSGQVENVRRTEPAELSAKFLQELRDTRYASDLPGDAPASLTPAISPDGRYMAFAQELPGQTFTYREHEFGPRTALFVRDLVTGAERKVMDPVEKELTKVNVQYAYREFPGYAWTPDGGSIVIMQGGKIRSLDVQSGDVTTIPFRARVHRVVSEQARGTIDIDDESLEVKFLQWPTSSPDGRRVVFGAVGKLWIVDLPAGTPRPLTDDMAPAFQLTPAWSPAGDRIAFTTWDDQARGHVWTVSADGGVPTRLSTEAGEYIHPAWSPDGRYLVVTKGPGPTAEQWNGWDRLEGWSAVRFTPSGGPALTLTVFDGIRETYFGPDGRIYFQHQEDPRATASLYRPFPEEDALRGTTVLVRSVDINGSDPRDHLRFPPRGGKGNRPVLSPDGRWVAFQAARDVYVTPLPSESLQTGRVSQIETNPNLTVRDRVRVGPWGGVFHRWRNRTALEFVSGDRYVTYDAQTGAVSAVPIRLRIPKPLPRGTIALSGAKIITLEGDSVIEQGAVVVQGARIVCVGSCDVSGADRVLDLSGKVIVPGFVDVHAHHTVEQSGVIPQHRPSSALALAYGVTTIVDPATDSESAFPLGEMTEAGLITGPRTFSSAEMVITHAYAWGDQIEIDTPEQAAHEVDRRADWGAATIKNFRQTRRGQHQLLIAATRDRGISVTGEGGPLFFDVGLAMDGQTGWEHIVAPLPLYHDATTFFGQAGAVYSPTVIVAGHVNGAKEYFRPRQGLLRDEKYRRFMPRAELLRQVQTARTIPKSEASFPIVAEGLADIVRAGGYGAIGEHGEQFGIGSHWEVWAYAEALTPLEALTVASRHGAHFIGLDHETGSIRAGKLADLVVLNADPLEDIRNTIDIAYVMKAGHLFVDDTLEQIWPSRRPYGPVPWR
jgi:Tol biopolymer transport system component